MLALRALGWGAKRISAQLGCSRNTVRSTSQRRVEAMDFRRKASVVGPHQAAQGAPAWLDRMAVTVPVPNSPAGLPVLLPGAQHHFKRPGRLVLPMKLPIQLGDSIRVRQVVIHGLAGKAVRT